MRPSRLAASLLALAGAASGCALVPFPDLAPDPEVAGEGEGTHLESTAFGDAGEQRGTAIAISAEAVVLAGYASGGIDFGTGALQELGSPSKPDCVIASFAPAGAPQWSRRFNDCVLRGVAVAVGGDVIVTGGASGDVDFGGGPLKIPGNAEDVVIARFDAQGAHRWSRSFGETGNSQSAAAIAVDPAGNSVITGSFWNKLDFGQPAGDGDDDDDREAITLQSEGKSDGFIARFDATGAVLWAQRFGDGHNQAGTAVAQDPQGNIVLAGWFKGKQALGEPYPESASEADLLVAKLSPAGELLWEQVAHSTSAAKAFGVAVDGAGNVLVAGSFRASLEIGAVALATAGDKDVVLLKLDENGVPLWGRAFGDDADQEALGVAVDPEGNVLLTGAFLGGLDLDASPLSAIGAADGFLAKLAPGGEVRWARSFGDAGEQGGAAVAPDALGNAWATGYFGGSIDFGGGALHSSGASDIFLVELSP